MNYLAVDYGLSKVGVAIALDTSLAEPLSTLKRRSDKDLLSKLLSLIDEYDIDAVIVGKPEGKLNKQVEKFVKYLGKLCEKEIVLINEDNTSKQAQFQARQAGKKKGKIKKKVHEWAAAIILQDYLDSSDIERT